MSAICERFLCGICCGGGIGEGNKMLAISALAMVSLRGDAFFTVRGKIFYGCNA